jgi:hypothetical protein
VVSLQDPTFFYRSSTSLYQGGIFLGDGVPKSLLGLHNLPDFYHLLPNTKATSSTHPLPGLLPLDLPGSMVHLPGCSDPMHLPVATSGYREYTMYTYSTSYYRGLSKSQVAAPGLCMPFGAFLVNP